MFGFFKKKKPDAETGQGPRLTANQFIALTLSDENCRCPCTCWGSAVRPNATSWGYGHSSTSGMWIVLRARSAFLLTVKPLPTSCSLLLPVKILPMLKFVMRRCSHVAY